MPPKCLLRVNVDGGERPLFLGAYKVMYYKIRGVAVLAAAKKLNENAKVFLKSGLL